MPTTGQTLWVIKPHSKGKKSSPPTEPSPGLPFPDGYELEDCHIFIANGNEAEDGLPCQGLPTFVAVNGVDVTPTSLITRTIERTKIGEDGVKTTSLEEVQTTALDFNDGDIIHAIFDWHNPKWGENNWYSDILQIGSRSVGDEPEGYVNPPALPSGRIPNQLKSAFYAFYGMTYANSAAIANLDISNLTRMESMFTGAEAFNQDISHWDTSKVTTMEWMFCYTNFDQDISDWDVSSVTDMSNMFYAAFKFNQDLSQWCVSQFDSMPYYFDELADAWTEARPVWGTCPGGGNLELPDGYEVEDCHIFIANSSPVNLPIPNGTSPVFVAVDGVEKDYDTQVKGNAFDGSIIHAIFDWVNVNNAVQNWYSDITQFGLNSETGKRNQLKSGAYAFKRMTANPAALSNLDTSNLTDMESMFEETTDFNSDISGWDTSKVTNMGWMFSNAASFDQDISKWNTSNVEDMVGMLSESKFNQDISGWNTSKVTDMSEMFNYATSFNQDLSQWCVVNIGSRPGGFDESSGFAGQTAKQPQWGNCPRGENIKLPDGYDLEDCHIFIANGNAVDLPIPSGTLPTFVAVNGVDATPTSFVARTVEVEEIGEDGVTTTSTEEVEVASLTASDGDIIHAIFDWHNKNSAKQNWYSDIIQFGLNSETGKRNQLKNAEWAFYQMQSNPDVIANLDVSNLVKMYGMFYNAPNFDQDISGWDVSGVKNMISLFRSTPFNQDISGWNVSKVTKMDWMFTGNTSFNQDISGWNVSKVANMNQMFWDASAFNQDLSQWCVSNIGSKPSNFDTGSGFAGQTAKQPQWGTCPRGEDGA